MELHHYLNGAFSALAAGGLSYVVLKANIHEGLIVKCGLVMMILGLTGTALLIFAQVESFRGLWNAGLLTRAGLCVVIAGYWWRRHKAGHPMLRASDWCEPPRRVKPVPPDKLRHVVGGKG